MKRVTLRRRDHVNVEVDRVRHELVQDEARAAEGAREMGGDARIVGVRDARDLRRPPFAELRVTLGADDLHVVEGSKRVGHRSFAREEPLAFVAPRLKVVGIGAVLDEADDPLLGTRDVSADDGGDDSAAMLGAVERERVAHAGRVYVSGGRATP